MLRKSVPLAVLPLAWLLLAAGCAASPEEVRVGSGGMGEHWEVAYWEGPVTLRVEASEESGRTGVDEYTVEGYGLRRRGWGRLLPWAWFRASRLYLYLVYLRGPSGTGGAFYSAYEPIPGFFSRPDLATGHGVDGPSPPDGWSWEACRAARDHLIGR